MHHCLLSSSQCLKCLFPVSLESSRSSHLSPISLLKPTKAVLSQHVTGVSTDLSPSFVPAENTNNGPLRSSRAHVCALSPDTRWCHSHALPGPDCPGVAGFLCRAAGPGCLRWTSSGNMKAGWCLYFPSQRLISFSPYVLESIRLLPSILITRLVDSSLTRAFL